MGPGEAERGAAALRLLDLVCRLYEANDAEAVTTLAAAAGAGVVPPLLAAVLHRRRVLGAPPRFASDSAYRQARRHLAEARRARGAEADQDQVGKAAELALRI